jgi:2-keto-4-pentenoate hydratase/2-oxohepta-3-ene-1,7-dioic acid hydratase in catechol pathway
MNPMNLYLGLTENSAPHQTRIFADIGGYLVDLNLAYAKYLSAVQGDRERAYELAGFFFPTTIAGFMERGKFALKALEDLANYMYRLGARNLDGPSGEKVIYEPREIRLLPPLVNPEKSFVTGFSDKARIEAMPKAEIPTGFYKLPQTFVTTGAPILWPKFSAEVDADACLAVVVGKAGRRIPPEQAWEYVGGVTLLIDVTARDINKREGATTNNLLGKNFPSSTSLGPAVLLAVSRNDVEALDVELSIDGAVKQKFNLRQCVFTFEQIIARWSILGIKPGDVLAIGASMALTGNRLQNPVTLYVGSTIRCSSSAIGELAHRVVSAEGTH